jgi:hypothetical protein
MNANTMKKDIGLTIEKVEIPPTNSPTVGAPEFLRLPRPGRLCPHTGLSRSYINSLILPSGANGHRPPVKSFVIRKRGARTGVRLVDYQDLRRYILEHAETGVGKEAE